MKRKAEKIDKGSKVSKKAKNHRGQAEGRDSKITKKPKRKVDWDWGSLAKQEQDRLNNNMKETRIDEPKTPFIIYEGGDNDYLNKLNQVYKIKPTIKEVLDDVTDKLKEGSNRSDLIEVEVIDEDGHRKKEYFQKEHQSPIEFLQKRKQNYHNEYTEAKNLMSSPEVKVEAEALSEKEDEELDNLTLKNTLLNKVVGIKSKVNKTNNS